MSTPPDDKKAVLLEKISESEGWINHTVYKPKPAHPIVNTLNKLRLELESFDVDPVKCTLLGRIYYDLSQQALVEEVTLDVKQNLFFQDADGNILPHDNQLASKTIKHLPGHDVSANEPLLSVDTAHKQPKILQLKTGTSEIRFQLMVPKNMIPTFNYFQSQTGVSVINNYSIGASTKINGTTINTDAIFFNVKAMAQRAMAFGYSSEKFELVIPDKVISLADDDAPTFDVAVGQTAEMGWPRMTKASIEIYQVVNIASTKSVNKIQITKSKRLKEGANVLEQYRLDDHAPPVKGNWVICFEREDVVLSTSMPSVCINGFTCDYVAKIETDVGEHEVTLILADDTTDYIDGSANNQFLSAEAKATH